MGFFKKIGKAIKKATKQISIKNAVKIGGMLDPTGLVSGLQDAHYAKKAGDAEAAAQMAQEAGQNAIRYATSNQTILGSAINGATGQVGASVVDNTVNTWLKANWWKLLFPIVGIFLLVKMLRPQPRRSAYRR